MAEYMAEVEGNNKVDSGSDTDGDDESASLMEKREAYGFGLGKRAYSFGLGRKRAPDLSYSFGMGKRAGPGDYGLALGKREGEAAYYNAYPYDNR